MTIEILPRATDDLVAGFRFYEKHIKGLGAYFRSSLFQDLEALHIAAGAHPRVFSEKFPFAIYYKVAREIIRIRAILDCRRNPRRIRTLRRR